MANHSDVTSYNESWNARMEAQHIVDSQSRNNKVILISVLAVLAVVVIAVLSVFFVKFKGIGDSGGVSADDAITHGQYVITHDTPDNIDKWGGISLGKGLVAGTSNPGTPTVTLYFDHLCTHCNHLEHEFGEDLAKMADEGKITLVLRPLAFMHEVSYLGAQADLYIASVAPESFYTFHKGYVEQFDTPILSQERDTAPTLEEINALAKESGLTDNQIKELDDVLNEGTMVDYLDDLMLQFREDGMTGTPSIFVDGEQIKNWSTDLMSRLEK